MRTFGEKNSNAYLSLNPLCILSSVNALLFPTVNPKYNLTTCLSTLCDFLFKYNLHLKKRFFCFLKREKNL